MDKLRLELLATGMGLFVGSVVQDPIIKWTGLAMIAIAVIMKVVSALRPNMLKP